MAISRRRLRVNFVRVVLGSGTLAWLLYAVLEHPAPLVMAVGMVPLAWIALEAVWRLSPDERDDS